MRNHERESQDAALRSLEAQLRQLPEVDIPEALEGKLLAAIPAVPPRRSRPIRWRRVGWAAAAGIVAAATLAAVLSGLDGGRQSGAPHAAETAAVGVFRGDAPAREISIEQTDSKLSYEGVIFLEGPGPVRKFRRSRMRRVTWVNTGTGLEMVMIEPREEIILVPAPIH